MSCLRRTLAVLTLAVAPIVVVAPPAAIATPPTGIHVTQVGNFSQVAAPGGDVIEDVTVTNGLATNETFNSISDSYYGDITTLHTYDPHGDGNHTVKQTTCAASGVLGAGASYQCTFTGHISGTQGYSAIDFVYAHFTPPGGSTPSDSNSGDKGWTVTVGPGAVEGISVSDTPAASSVPYTTNGTYLDHTVTVSNTGGTPLQSVGAGGEDSIGHPFNMSGCPIPVPMQVGAEVICHVQVLERGDIGSVQTDTFTAGGQDETLTFTNAEATADVTITPPTPTHIVVTLTPTPSALPLAGGTVSYALSVHNDSTVQAYMTSAGNANFGQILQASGPGCTPAAIAAGDTYSCAFTEQITGAAGAHTDTISVVAYGPTFTTDGDTESASATVTIGTATGPGPDPTPTPSPTPSPSVNPNPIPTLVHCTITDVRGLLATTAKTDIAKAHCATKQVVIKMASGAPVLKHGAVIKASSTAKPSAAPGAGKVWTLRVEKIAPKVGTQLPIGSIETIDCGWEATPKKTAGKPGAKFL